QNNYYRRYWIIFLLLACFLTVMVRFPIRLNLTAIKGADLHYVAPEIYIYSVMIAICLIAAVQVYRHFQHGRRRLMAVILTCAVLAAWQIVDIGILRLPNAWQEWRHDEGDFTYTYR